MIFRKNNWELKNEMELNNWTGTLKNIPCFIIGNSPSLDDLDISKLENHFTIGINKAFLKIDPTILIWQDIEIYDEEKENIKKLKSILYSRNTSDPNRVAFNFKLLGYVYNLRNSPARLTGYGTTAPLAFQLAYYLGCNPIVFIGCDCRYRGEKTNFYGKNKYHDERTLSNCLKGLKWIGSLKTDRTIVNCSENDYVKYKGYEEVLKDCLEYQKSREYYKNKILNWR